MKRSGQDEVPNSDNSLLIAVEHENDKNCPEEPTQKPWVNVGFSRLKAASYQSAPCPISVIRCDRSQRPLPAHFVNLLRLK